MKKKLVVVLVLLLLMVTACGANPVEKLKEAAAEQVAETLVEQASGLDNVQIDTDGGSVSYSVVDEDGNTTTGSIAEQGEIDAIEGMGFTIPLPDGLVDGTLQQIDKNGELAMITGVFSVVDLTAEQFVESMHTALTNEGFVYTDTSASGREKPDLNDPLAMIAFAYQHPDGYMFNIIWGEESVILGLTKADTDGNGEQEVTADTFDGSIKVNKTKYAVNEQIKITLTINTPLADNAWVGIVPSGTPHGSETENDAVDVAYDYVTNAQDGIIMLNAPYDAGNYDVRLFSSDAGGVELDSVSITVE